MAERTSREAARLRQNAGQPRTCHPDERIATIALHEHGRDRVNYARGTGRQIHQTSFNAFQRRGSFLVGVWLQCVPNGPWARHAPGLSLRNLEKVCATANHTFAQRDLDAPLEPI